ncbi:TMV resistance protein N-like protein [Tanacetum coccineum]|uniref:ADP-ribosyl cyclase/cyclic ADP-ribose hydrolase n=1 Tax=Tanacetum coccineum TaxID=301880 RepID=A0ABQ5CWL0_9ASTR
MCDWVLIGLRLIVGLDLQALLGLDLALSKVVEAISFTSKSKPLALPWGWTPRLDSRVRASLVLGFPSISPIIVVVRVRPLSGKGIYMFKDDEKLQRRKSISPELVKAIQESMVVVVVFSNNYTTSSWCLEELAKIIKCRDLIGQRVLPVFYDVDLSDRWREALEAAASLSRWDVQITSSGREAECIKQIVRNILSYTLSCLVENLIGMESRVEDVKSLFGKGSSRHVCTLGIWGIGGIGKTTIARAVYHQISYEFEGSSFVEDVRENSCNKVGIKSLQEKLLLEILMEEPYKVKDCDDGIHQIQRRLGRKKLSGITMLIEKSLLAISNGNFHMHDLIQELGRYIVCECYPYTIVWVPEEIKEVVMTSARLETVEAIVETKLDAFSGRPIPSCSEEVYATSCCIAMHFNMAKLVGLEMQYGKMKQLQIERKKCAAVNHRLSIDVPGSKMPNWFSNYRLGNTIAVNLPQSRNTNMIGLAICYHIHSNWGNIRASLRIKFRPIGEKFAIDKQKLSHAAKHGDSVMWIGYMPIDILKNLFHGIESEDLVISLESKLCVTECEKSFSMEDGPYQLSLLILKEMRPQDSSSRYLTTRSMSSA